MNEDELCKRGYALSSVGTRFQIIRNAQLRWEPMEKSNQIKFIGL
jgi:hypothetical protein